MIELKTAWKRVLVRALEQVRAARGLETPIDQSALVVELPPKPELGDLGFPLFPFAKAFRAAPPAIAKEVAAAIAADPEAAAMGQAKAEGPYLNVFFDRAAFGKALLDKVSADPAAYGRVDALAGVKIMIEFSSPNANKPLHLGHLRNDALGESVSRILKANGATVRKINLVNDRGIHICKSMYAYKLLGEGKTPESEGMKSDAFVGDYYVRFGKLKETDPEVEAKAQAMLLAWEANDPETRALWERMNGWAISGIRKTYERTGISFDDYYYESKTYQTGKDEVRRGLEMGAFYKAPDGSVRVNLEDIGLDEKVLLRSDGTSIYITQDIGTAIHRHADWPFDRSIYVVASEQQYHFKVLFELLRRLGYEWARNLYHLSYGLVNLPEGRMKTREGTVVDADALLDKLRELAKEEIAAKGREDSVGDLDEVSEAIALGAVHFYLLQANPVKDMIYDPKESLSFAGATGPYIQYMGARISSMIRKHEAGEGMARSGTVRPELLAADAEWDLARRVAAFPETVTEAAAQYSPAVLANYLYELAGAFSKYYHDNPILTAKDADLAATRLALAQATRTVLKNGLDLVCIPFLEAM